MNWIEIILIIAVVIAAAVIWILPILAIRFGVTLIDILNNKKGEK